MSVSYYNIHSPHVAVDVVAHANRIVAGVYYYYFHAGRGFVMVDGEIRSSDRELLRPGGRPSIKKAKGNSREISYHMILYYIMHSFARAPAETRSLIYYHRTGTRGT